MDLSDSSKSRLKLLTLESGITLKEEMFSCCLDGRGNGSTIFIIPALASPATFTNNTIVIFEMVTLCEEEFSDVSYDINENIYWM